MSLNIDNCPRCGKVYVKNNYGLCANCIKEIDLQYEKCLKYLRENRACHMYELSEATGVSVKQITKFIREGRISIVHNPNMSYHCEVCNEPIRHHSICDSCRQKLTRDSSQLQDEGLRKQDNNRMSYNIKDRLQDRSR